MRDKTDVCLQWHWDDMKPRGKKAVVFITNWEEMLIRAFVWQRSKGEATILSDACYHSCVAVSSKLPLISMLFCNKESLKKDMRRIIENAGFFKTGSNSPSFHSSMEKKELGRTLGVNRVALMSHFVSHWSKKGTDDADCDELDCALSREPF